MPRFSFENIHKNKKFAFLDGLLCGLVLGYLCLPRRDSKPVKKTNLTLVDASDEVSKHDLSKFN